VTTIDPDGRAALRRPAGHRREHQPTSAAVPADTMATGHHAARGLDHTPQLLASMRDQWQARYRRAVAETRTAYLMAATYELLAAQAERTPEEAR
jgi:hypothetical protein